MDFLIVFTAYLLGLVFLGIAVWAGMRILGVKYKAKLIRQIQYIAVRFGFYWAGKAMARFRIPARHALEILKGLRSANMVKRPAFLVPENPYSV